MTSPPRLVLRFISGKYQGGEIPLQDAQELIVGRASDAGIVLVEEMVSRRHARIILTGAELLIEDLDSTNGTFVNGEKIQRASLKESDRVLIGTSILKVVSADAPKPSRRPPPSRSSIAPRGPARSMSGAIDEIPLPDLLQLLGTSKKSGVLVITSDEDVGKLYMHRGVVTFAEILDQEDLPPLKAAFRMLAWSRGTFDFDPPEERTLPVTINYSVQELLMEGLRQIDELNALRNKLPDLDTRLTVPKPLTLSLKDLSPSELDIFQLAYNSGHLAVVLNKSQATDLDTTTALIKLLNAGYLRKA